ncbi:MAG: hypothetical protein IJP21_05710 [Clostridia bacterium]|nr:hypothetical protein [Clostridia bacterium]
MLKLYFKKLFLTLCFIVNYFLLVGIIAFVWYLFLKDMFSETTTTAIVGILALWADLGIVVAIRYKGLSNKAILTEDLSFGRNFINILKSKDNLVHTLAFLSMLLPFCVTIAINQNTPFLTLVIGTIFLLLINGFVFLMVNTLLWTIAHMLIHHRNNPKI